MTEFDPKANKAAAKSESADRAAGKELKTTPHTVLPGQAVLVGGERVTEGGTVYLTAADSERLVHAAVVEKAKPAKAAKADDKGKADDTGKSDDKAQA